MRILYHHRTLGEGAEGVHIRAMVGALRALGHEVRVAALVGEQDASSRHRWSSLRRFIPDCGYELAEMACDVAARPGLARAMREFRPDVLYDRYNSYSSAAVMTARRLGVPSVLEVNAPVVYERTVYEHLRLRFPRLACGLERRILSGATHIVVVSSPLKDYLTKTHGIDGERICVLPNGVDPDRFRPLGTSASVRAELNLPAAATVIGFIGEARPWHGLGMLVDALARIVRRHPEVCLLLLGGNGSSEPALRAQVSARGLDRHVRFVDRVAHEDVPRFVDAMDIALSPRATFYASPLKIVEYMAMGKAIVAPAMPNIENLVEHERSALLFEPENVDALIHAVVRLVGNPPLRATLGAEARARVERRLNWQANARQVIALAARLCDSAEPGPESALFA